jgi:hypothetical protein
MAKDKADEGPRYRVLSDSFIDNHLRKTDDEISYDGFPGHNLLPLNDAAKAKAVEGAKAAEEAMAALIASTRPIGAQDVADMGKGIAEAVAKAVAEALAPAKPSKGGAPV